MNGFEGDINAAITYYNDLYNSTGPTNFVFANVLFNIN